MGSALIEGATGKTLWGFDNAGWYASAWTTGGSLDALRVTDDERQGDVGRVRPAGLLRFSSYAPLLRGFEPYTDLAGSLRAALPDPTALLEFAYDWRLSVEHNAKQHAVAADQHLAAWRHHPKGSSDARLVLVGHSMGGLVARYFTHVLGGASDVAVTVTLGTPYYGAVKAAVILNQGRGTPVPLPKRRLRRLAATMPGLHDLLPFYRCVDEGQTARLLAADDVATLGGDPGLAAESIARHAQLLDGEAGVLRLLVGTDQPTMQSLSLDAGKVTALQHAVRTDADGIVLAREDLRGDETVFRRAAAAFGLSPATLPQSHGSIAKTPEAISHVLDVLRNDTLGPPLGATELGVDVPDMVSAAEPLVVRVDGPDARSATCLVHDASTGRLVATPRLRRSRQDGEAEDLRVARVDLTEPGTYKIEVKAGGSSAVVQHTMVVAPGDLQLDEDDT
ncbi:MAG: hypothetical protein WAL50_01995 [Kineosporiaceae bacterium]